MPAVFNAPRKVGATLAVLISALLFLGLTLDSTAHAEQQFGRRRQMLALTNDDRQARDRADLSFAARVSRYAKAHSREMADKGYLFHSSDDQLRNAFDGLEWSLGGENVGVGGSLESLEDAFMASKLHRENILRPEFDHAAIGVARADGRIWVTVIFYG
jgi:uncharacterized protein YkwD